MIPDGVGPLSRPFPLHRLTGTGTDVAVDATEPERVALARDLGLVAIGSLSGQFRISGTADRVRVVGRVRADIEQTCVVTLDPFPATVDEAVEVEFAAPEPRRRAVEPDEVELSLSDDEPDELVGDRIDLGAITAEFLALGLDPYPRKPGVAFETPADTASGSPFAGLAGLRDRKNDP